MANVLTRNHTVDLFKFIAVLFVVGIHTSLFLDVNDDLYFFVVHIIFRLAVPFFAICSGYFLSKSVKNDFKITPICKQVKKLIKLYAFWTLLYFLFDIPFAISRGYFTLKNYKGFVINAVLSGSHYHLWYLLSLIYALPLFYLCIRFVKRKLLCPVMLILYMIKALSYGYIQWLPVPIKASLDSLHMFDALFNSIFLMLPLLLLGYYISVNKIPNQKWNIIGFLLSLSFLIIEAFTLRNFGQESVSYIIFTFPTVYFAFCAIINMKFGSNLQISKMLGSASLIIYCFHPMVLEVLPNDLNSILKFIIVSAVAILVAIVYYYTKNFYKKKYQQHD